MEITGKIIAVMPPASGVSSRTGNPWMSQEYVIETHDQYPRKCCFRVFGEDKIKQYNIQPGEELTVSFDIDAHEYNGRWFNEIRTWNISRTVQQQAPVPPQAGDPGYPFPEPEPMSANEPSIASQQAAGGSSDDLPF